MSIGELNKGLPTHGDQIPFITAKGFAGELLLNRLEECNRLLLCRLLKFCHLCDVDIPEQRSRRYSICGVERKGDASRRGCRSWPSQFLPSMIYANRVSYHLSIYCGRHSDVSILRLLVSSSIARGLHNLSSMMMLLDLLRRGL
jgi:hypothetical protein